MNDILEFVARVLSPSSPDDVYKGILPDAPNELIALFQYDAEPPTAYFGRTQFNHNVQARTRAKTPERAFALAADALAALDRYTDEQIAITAKTSIMNIGQDDKHRYEYTVNFSIFER